MYTNPRLGYILNSGTDSQTLDLLSSTSLRGGAWRIVSSRIVTVARAIGERIDHMNITLGLDNRFIISGLDEDPPGQAEKSRKAALRRMVERAVINEVAVAGAPRVRGKTRRTYTGDRDRTEILSLTSGNHLSNDESGLSDG